MLIYKIIHGNYVDILRIIHANYTLALSLSPSLSLCLGDCCFWDVCLFSFAFFGGVQISQHIPITPIVVPTKTLSTILVWPSGIHQKQYM